MFAQQPDCSTVDLIGSLPRITENLDQPLPTALGAWITSVKYISATVPLWDWTQAGDDLPHYWTGHLQSQTGQVGHLLVITDTVVNTLIITDTVVNIADESVDLTLSSSLSSLTDTLMNMMFFRGGYVPGEAINIWATIDNQVFLRFFSSIVNTLIISWCWSLKNSMAIAAWA